ncbi:hypothetical protein F4859DRAFT_15858 [Xylaria cf. heliscus]|nr:hypothetical protein F4859DRAFT_15858 [Xylaria cf. heliscus]
MLFASRHVDTGDKDDMMACKGCYRRGPDLVFPLPYISPFCLHKPRLCLDCVQRNIELTIDQEVAKFIPCPECGTQLDDNDIYRLTTAGLYEKSDINNKCRIFQNLTEEIECIVCIENIPRKGFPKSPISPVCSHEAQCCLSCLATHLTSQLESQSPKSFTCPQCRGALPYASIQQYASPETFTQYDKLLARNGLAEEPNFCWCTAGCGSGQLHPEGRENPLMICTNCRGKTCFTHQSPWHDGLTCREFDNLDATGTANETRNIEPYETRSLRNKFSIWLGRGKRNIIVGGVARLENDQEYKDRRLAEKLTKEEEDLERKRQKSAEEAEKQNRLRNSGAQEQRQELERRQEQERRAQEEAWNRKQAEKYRAQEEKARKRQQLEEDRKRRRAEEAASESALSTISKLCPRDCGARIQKTEGCDHMTCRQCHHEFCWLCFADWRPIKNKGNAYHKPDCKYHSSKL